MVVAVAGTTAGAVALGVFLLLRSIIPSVTFRWERPLQYRKRVRGTLPEDFEDYSGWRTRHLQLSKYLYRSKTVSNLRTKKMNGAVQCSWHSHSALTAVRLEGPKFEAEKEKSSKSKVEKQRIMSKLLSSVKQKKGKLSRARTLTSVEKTGRYEGWRVDQIRSRRQLAKINCQWPRWQGGREREKIIRISLAVGSSGVPNDRTPMEIRSCRGCDVGFLWKSLKPPPAPGNGVIVFTPNTDRISRLVEWKPLENPLERF
uniref:Uncharacterized protein n=1 Tax=Anopheles farauti TaxID=69004 RepID=A0A182Q1E0_9DIPT